MAGILTPPVNRTLKLKDARLFREQAYINGEWVDADNRSTFEVTNPADESVLGRVPNMGSAETRRAPALASVSAHAEIVAPVVTTSSTRRSRRP